jgi:hypothetical protein
MIDLLQWLKDHNVVEVNGEPLLNAGGKPSKGTKKDKRIRTNKKGKK